MNERTNERTKSKQNKQLKNKIKKLQIKIKEQNNESQAAV